MFNFDSRLVFFISVLGLLIIVLGCSQTDDIASSKSVTNVWLTAERLPTAATGMTYELWVSSEYPSASLGADQAKSLGQFSYMASDTLVAFTDAMGVVREDSNLFVLTGDLFDYNYLFVSVQNLSEPGTGPGPVMLMEEIAGNSDTLRLFFPKHDSLFDATIRCNFETPTDGNSYRDGYGLWFSAYSFLRQQIDDTTDVEISYVDSTIEPIYDNDSNILNLPTLYAPYPDSVWATFDTVLLDFGRDTLALGVTQTDAVLPTGHIHYGAKQHIIRKIDSTQIPRVIKDYTITWDTTARSVNLDVFTQDLYGLPDLSDAGWEYKGWVVSTEIDTSAFGKFTPPAWDFITGELVIPGYQGGLISTGPFTDVTDSDDSNPYSNEIPWEVDSIPGADDSPGEPYTTVIKRPRFPGEDFIDTAALAAASGGNLDIDNWGLNLFPYGDMASRATVFVTIEPTNRASDTTNFPLIAFGFNFPNSLGHGFYNAAGYWPLLNWTGTSTGAKGFPKLVAEIQRL